MAHTKYARKTATQTKKIYRSRVKTSHCRKLGRLVCSKKINCKMANGTQRTYCRKLKNRHV